MLRSFGKLLLLTSLFLSGPSVADVLRCDADMDGDIDRADLILIFAAANTLASGPDDPRDGNGDGVINIIDVRVCQARCTQPYCAEPAANVPPVADAGDDQTVEVGETVTLDGSGSSDADGDPLSFAWSFLSTPAGSTVSLSDPAAVMPLFVPDLPGDYLVQLVVNDGTIDSPPDDVVIVTVPGNSLPVADAGPDQTALVNETVTLDGSGSFDVDGDPLSFSWNAVSLPAGSAATLSDSTAVMPSFTVDQPGAYTFELVVDDGVSGASFPDSVTVTTTNTPPVADAGPDQSAFVTDTVTLDGSGSFDADGDALTFSWSLNSVPPGSAANLDDPSSVAPSFTIDVPGDYVAQLIVNDGLAASSPDTVVVATINSKPVADAGEDQTVELGQTVTLDGSGSSDVDGDSLTFAWSFTSRPAGSTATLSDTTAVMPTFPADAEGLFVVQLIVSDGLLDSDPDTTTITVEVAPNNPPVLAAIGGQSGDELTSISFTATATDPDTGDTLTFSLDAGAPAGAAIDPASGLFSWTPAEDQGPGDYPVTVRVTDDGAPNLDDLETINIAVAEVNQAPVLAPVGNQTIEQESELTFTATATDDDVPANTLTFSLDAGAPSGASIDPVTGDFSWTPTTSQGPGDFPVTIRVTDDGTPVLDDFETITIVVAEEPNTAPVLDPIGDQAVDEEATLNFTATANDTDAGDQLTFSLDTGAPAGASIDPTSGLFSWTPAESDGPNDFTVTVRVTDDGNPNLDDSETINIAVAEVNQAPVLDPIGGQTVVQESELSFTATASDADLPANTLTFSLDTGAPAGATIDPVTGAFSWTPSTSDGPGDIPVTVRVTDDGTPNLDDSETVTITIEASNQPPVANAGPDQTIVEIDTAQLDGSASSDPDGDTLTFLWSLLSGPAGGAVNFSDTGVESPTATFSQVGSYTLQLDVGDGVETDTDTVVIAVNPAPVISISDASVGEGDAGTATLTFNVTLSPTIDRVVTIDFATADGSATLADNDYNANSGTLTFAANEAAQSIDVTVNGDTDLEPTENLFVDLSNPTNALFGDNQGQGTIVNDDSAPALVLTPTVLNLQTLESGTFTVTLPDPAPAGGLLVNLASNNGTIASVPASVTVLESAVSATFDATAGNVSGSALVTASASGFTSDSSTVNVAARTLSLVLADSLVGEGRTVDGTVTLSEAAPAGGVTVTLVSNDITTATVAPPTVSIAQGQVSAGFQVTGVNAGATTITGTAPGYDAGNVGVTVTDNLITTPVNLNVPLGQTASLPVSITPDPAPTGGLLVTLVSDDPSRVEIVTPTVTIPEGQFSANATVLGASIGQATLSASSPGFATDFTLASTTAEFDIVQTNVTFNEAFPTETLTVQLESIGNPVAAPAPVDVILTAADPGCVDVNSPETIATGFASVTTAPLQYGGTTALPCTTQVTASNAGITPDSVNVTVQPAPGITLFGVPTTIGAGLQDSGFTARLGASQHGGVTLRIESSDPGTVLLAPNANTPGTAFIEFDIPNGQIDATYTIQGVEGASGTAQITASATGFNSQSGDINVVLPAVRLVGLVTSIDTLDPDDPFYAQVGVANSLNSNLQSIQEARVGGGGLTVTMSNADPAVAELVTTTQTGQAVTVQIPEGDDNSPTTVSGGGSAFSPGNAGTTTVTATIPGFVQTDAAIQQVAVTAPGITLFSLPTTIGAGLQDSGFTARLGASQHGGVTLRIESDDPSRVLVAPNASSAGTGFIEFTVPNGTTDVSYTIQALEGVTGSAQLTASATGFVNETATINVVQPAVRLFGLLPAIDSLDPDDAFYAQVGLANSLNTSLQTIQEARTGGGGLTATFSNSDATVANLVTNSVTAQSLALQIPEAASVTATSFAAGGVAFSPLDPGQTTVAVSIPGFAATDAASQIVDVTAPGITLFSLPTRLGAGLQDSLYTARLGASQHGGVTMRIESSDPSRLLIAPNATTVGSAFIDVPLANGAIDASYTLQAIEGTSGTVQVTASAPGFISQVGDVTIEEGAFRIVGLATSVDTLDPDDQFYLQVGVRNSVNSSLQVQQEARTGGGGLTVTFSNSEATIGELVTTASTGQSVAVVIPEAQGNTPTSVAAGGTAFSPLGTGTTTVSGSIPGFSGTTAGSVDITVDAPGISLFSLPYNIGAGLQDSGFTARLGASQHGGVTVRIESSQPGVVLVAPNGSSPGAAFVDIPVANGATDATYTIQGLENASGTVTLTASAPGFINQTGSVTVVTPAVRILGLGTNHDALGATDDFYVDVGVPNAGNASLQVAQEARIGGGGLTATISNSVASVAQLVTNTATGQSVTVTIPEGVDNSPTTQAAGGVSFDGLAFGTTLVTASIPNFITTDAAIQSVNVQGIAIPGGQQNLTQLAGTTITSSSDFSTSYLPENAIDESNSTSWCTANNDPGPSLTIDFASDVTVSSIQMLNFQFNPTYSFLSGTYRILDGGGGELFNSGTVSMTNGGINLPVSPAVGGARTVVFNGVAWNSIEPCLSELAVVGTSP